jgi:hypothetical protein
MAQEGDIVFMIGADVAGLTRAGQAGERSLADMEKAAKALEREISKVGQAGVDFQREMNKLTGVTREVGRSARDSAAAFEAFDKSRAQVDALRASIDPLFAASKRYEQALGTLDTALEQGTISARQHEAMVEQLSAAYLRADGAAGTMAAGTQRMGMMSAGARQQLQQVGFQVQDFAVQVGAGTSATQAFAQQFPQMAGAFGPWGVAIGTAAAILVPLGAAFLSASANADTMTAALERQKTIAEELLAVSERLRLDREMIGSGAQTEAEQKAMEEINRLASERYALEYELGQLQADANANLGMINSKEVERVKAALATNEANRATNQSLLERIQRERAHLEATKLVQAAAEQFKALQQQLGAADISSPWQGVLGWIQQAINKAGEYAKAAQIFGEVGARGDPRQFGANAGGTNTFGVENFATPDGLGGGGGGGGGRENPLVAQLEALRQQMMTEEQIEMESYARRQEMLAQALDQQLLTQQEYAQLMQRSQQEHSDKMSEIDVYRYGSGLDKASAFFGDMASAMQGGNEEMLKISKAFGAAQALISAWQGAAEALKLPFPSNIAAFAKVLSTGLGAVNAIKGARKGGSTSGGGSGTSAAAAAPASPTQTMNFTITNDPFGMGERFARQLASQLNEAQRNGSSIRATVNAI